MRENLSHDFLAFDSLGHSLACKWNSLVSSHYLLSVCLSLCPTFPPLEGQHSYWVTAHPNDYILTWLPPHKLCFQIRLLSQVRASTYRLWGDTLRLTEVCLLNFPNSCPPHKQSPFALSQASNNLHCFSINSKSKVSSSKPFKLVTDEAWVMIHSGAEFLLTCEPAKANKLSASKLQWWGRPKDTHFYSKTEK